MDKRNATASWSGYLYQGKIGIFLALQQLNNIKYEDISKWKIEYESAEDVDIKNDEKVYSRHQVKAYRDAKYPNDYKDVLSILEYKLNDNNEKVINTKGFRICDFDDKLNPLPIEVDENSRYLHTITETLGFELDEQEFQKIYKRAAYVANPNKIKLFQYPNGNFYCKLDELDKLCKDEINKILKKGNHIFQNIDIHHENILNHLLRNLDVEIRKKHIEGGNKFPEIKFKDIYDIIISTNEYKKLNTDALRESFSKSWEIFVKELDENYIRYDNIQEQKISSLVTQIYLWDDEKFIQFLKNINPDESEIGEIQTIDIPRLFKIDNMKDVFFQCLLDIKDEEFKLEQIGYDKDEGYLLTAINRSKSNVKSVINNIINNSQKTNEIFNKSYLINGLIDDIKFSDSVINAPESEKINNNWGDRVSEKEKFYNPKMQFITLEKATEKLNRSLEND